MNNRNSIDLNFEHFRQSVRASGLLAVGAFAACVALAALASTRLTPTYTSDAKLLFTNVDRSTLPGLGGADANRLQSLLADQTPLATQIEIIRSRPLLQETIDILDLTDDEGNPLSPGAIDQRLEVDIIGGTDIVQIVFTDPNPETSASVVNTLAAQYRENSVIANRNSAREAKEFLLAQLPQTEAVVRQAESELQSFLERNQIGVLTEEASSLVARMEALSNQIAIAEASLESAAAQSATLQNRLNLSSEDAFLVSTLRSNPGVQDAILSLQTVERELASQQARFGPNSPVIRQLTAEQDSLQTFLQEQVQAFTGSSRIPSSFLQGTPGEENITQALIQVLLSTETESIGLQRQLSTLESYQAEYQNRLARVPSLISEQRALERRIVAAEETYSSLLTRLQELQVEENEATYNTRIVQSATPPMEPDSGRKVQIIALGAFAGSLLAVAIVITSQILSAPIRRGSTDKNYIPAEEPYSFQDVPKD